MTTDDWCEQCGLPDPFHLPTTSDPFRYCCICYGCDGAHGEPPTDSSENVRDTAPEDPAPRERTDTAPARPALAAAALAHFVPVEMHPPRCTCPACWHHPAGPIRFPYPGGSPRK